MAHPNSIKSQTTESCRLADNFDGHRGQISLVDGCGEEEGFGGGFVGRALKVSAFPSRQRRGVQQSKVVSGAWIMSVSLFLSIDLSPEVRTREGAISPSWPILLALRSAKRVLKTQDWTKFFVVSSSQVESQQRNRQRVRADSSCALVPRVLLGATEADFTSQGDMSDSTQPTLISFRNVSGLTLQKTSKGSTVQGRRLGLRTGVTTPPPLGVALVPFEGSVSGERGDQLAKKLCGLAAAFSYVVVGTCDAVVSDSVRRLIASTLPSYAVQSQMSTRRPTRGSIVVLTAPKCSASRHETGLALLRLAQASISEQRGVSGSNGDTAVAFEWARVSRFVYYSSEDRFLSLGTSVVDSLGRTLVNQMPCSVVVPSLAVPQPCSGVGRGGESTGRRFGLAPGNKCSGQGTGDKKTLPVCISHPSLAPTFRPSAAPLPPFPAPHPQPSLPPSSFAPPPLSTSSPSPLPLPLPSYPPEAPTLLKPPTSSPTSWHSNGFGDGNYTSAIRHQNNSTEVLIGGAPSFLSLWPHDSTLTFNLVLVAALSLCALTLFGWITCFYFSSLSRSKEVVVYATPLEKEDLSDEEDDEETDKASGRKRRKRPGKEHYGMYYTTTGTTTKDEHRCSSGDDSDFSDQEGGLEEEGVDEEQHPRLGKSISGMYYSTKHKKEDGPSNPDSESFETASPEKRASTQHGFAGVYHTSK
mmetsp:Transcript_658/g.1271  ORF Transcript_658/g.1271 Transcript_658/m.1271 type:complete len:696 (-) Transcript_658:640-2727(-)